MIAAASRGLLGGLALSAVLIAGVWLRGRRDDHHATALPTWRDDGIRGWAPNDYFPED